MTKRTYPCRCGCVLVIDTASDCRRHYIEDLWYARHTGAGHAPCSIEEAHAVAASLRQGDDYDNDHAALPG